MSDNIIGIHTCSVSTEITDFARRGVFRTVPIILYKVNDGPVKQFMIRRPIEIFRENMEYGSLRNIVQGDDKFLSISGKAYSQMRSYINQNINKVVADMITHTVVNIILDLKRADPEAKNTFFIDSTDTNKIIGRLGYLYLESEANTIAFVTYKAGGLLTDILNDGSERIKFDINYFKRQERTGERHSAIIPNDYMESLTQIVFYDISSKQADRPVSPLRCDILSQGISTSRIREKVMSIEKILTDPKNMTTPHPEGGGPGNSWVRIPRILNDCINAEKLYVSAANNVLEGLAPWRK